MPKLSPDLDLLKDLNEIVDIVVGNETPQDASFNERTTLPEILAYAELYPTNIQAVRAARNSLKNLSTKLDNLSKKIEVLHTKIVIKNKKYPE
jgi:hypothetical protein